MTHNIFLLSMDYEDITKFLPKMNDINEEISEQNLSYINTFISSLETSIEQMKNLKKKLSVHRKEMALQLEQEGEETLLPCPMCNKPSEILEGTRSGMFRIGCSDEKCYCSISHSVPFTSRKLAISLWNKRYPNEK